ncbi:hypothetical protein LTR04_002462, partial [Oleoguttula sp. CCFEE 6159]
IASPEADSSSAVNFEFGFDDKGDGDRFSRGDGLTSQGGAKTEWRLATNDEENGRTSGKQRSSAVGRSSSVWEDGEKFWEELTKLENLGEKTARLRIERLANASPERCDSSSPERHSSMLGARGTGGVVSTTPKLRVQAPSAQGTPMSLYDQEGFLRF